MTKTIEAIYDGKVFKPEKQLDLKPNTRVYMTIEVTEEPLQGRSFLQTARSLKLEGPSDWAGHLEDYLYGKETLVHE